jgi:hypothetical protein
VGGVTRRIVRLPVRVTPIVGGHVIEIDPGALTAPLREDDELCAMPGCDEERAPRLPCCAAHFAAVPVPEQVAWFEAAEAALGAPNVQRARREAVLRVGAVLRGVRV